MKRFFKILCIFLFAGIVLLFACADPEEEKDFSYYEDMDEITVNGNQIVIILGFLGHMILVAITLDTDSTLTNERICVSIKFYL